MADVSKDAPFKAVQVDALVRIHFVQEAPHYAPRHCARRTLFLEILSKCVELIVTCRSLSRSPLRAANLSLHSRRAA